MSTIAVVSEFSDTLCKHPWSKEIKAIFWFKFAGKVSGSLTEYYSGQPTHHAGLLQSLILGLGRFVLSHLRIQTSLSTDFVKNLLPTAGLSLFVMVLVARLNSF